MNDNTMVEMEKQSDKRQSVDIGMNNKYEDKGKKNIIIINLRTGDWLKRYKKKSDKIENDKDGKVIEVRRKR